MIQQPFIYKKAGTPTTGDYRVRFFDYDGTLLKTEFVDEGEDATPPDAPTHELLTFAGWNKTFTNITADTDIGAMYNTTDGATYAFITTTLVTTNTIPCRINKSNTDTLFVYVNGVLQHTLTASGNVSFDLTFADYGNHIVKYIFDTGTTGTYTLGQGNNTVVFIGADVQNQRNTLTKVFVGERTEFNITAFQYCYSLTSVIIPDSVTSISGSAFRDCYSLTSVIIPDSVTSIEGSAFQYCYSLTSVIIPDSVTIISGSAFRDCYSLTSVIIPDSVTSIEGNAFQYCYSLTSVIIPDSVTSISGLAFRDCYSLTKYRINRATFNEEDLTVSAGLTVTTTSTITGYSSGTTKGIVSVFLGATEVDPDNYSATANNTITFTAGVTEDDVVTVKYITDITTIGGTTTFTGINPITKIYVPDIAIDVYKNFTNWSTYEDYIYPLSDLEA